KRSRLAAATITAGKDRNGRGAGSQAKRDILGQEVFRRFVPHRRERRILIGGVGNDDEPVGARQLRRHRAEDFVEQRASGTRCRHLATHFILLQRDELLSL